MTTATVHTASSSLARPFALALTGSLFIAACAQIAVPVGPVPMTMQTFAVLLVGAAFGARLGAAAVVLYLLEGAVGLPVFSGFLSGPVAFAGPTAGYLLAFVPAAWLVGVARDRGLMARASTVVFPMVGATALILAGGGAWLALVFGADAWAVGVLPYLFGGALKIALAAVLAPKAIDVVRRFRM